MQRIVLVFSFIIVCASAKGQIDPLYAQYLNNPMLINPAYTGLNSQFTGSVSYRKQWAGFDGSPSTINASAHSSFRDNKVGAGIIILNDKIGVNTNTEVHATYSYKLRLDNKVISFGLQGGFVNYKNVNTDLTIYDPNDPAFANSSVVKPSFGVGVILTSEKYFIGVSVPRLLQPTSSVGKENIELYSRHFYGLGSYIFYASNDVWVKPSVLVKYVSGSPVSVDLNASVILKDQITAGLFTRNFETYGLLSQLKINDRYKLGYVFEMPTNQSVGTRYTSHEVTLGIRLGLFAFHDLNKTTLF